MDYFYSKIVEKLVLAQADKGQVRNKHKFGHNGDEMMDMDEERDISTFSDSGKRVIEQTIRQEVDALLEILLDLYLG